MTPDGVFDALEPLRILEFVERKPVGADAGIGGDNCRCLVALYMAEGLGLAGVQVSYQTARYDSEDGRQTTVLPGPVQKLVREFDERCESGTLSREEALMLPILRAAAAARVAAPDPA